MRLRQFMHSNFGIVVRGCFEEFDPIILPSMPCVPDRYLSHIFCLYPDFSVSNHAFLDLPILEIGQFYSDVFNFIIVALIP